VDVGLKEAQQLFVIGNLPFSNNAVMGGDGNFWKPEA
jgi:hypothetical protein